MVADPNRFLAGGDPVGLGPDLYRRNDRSALVDAPYDVLVEARDPDRRFVGRDCRSLRAGPEDDSHLARFRIDPVEPIRTHDPQELVGSNEPPNVGCADGKGRVGFRLAEGNALVDDFGESWSFGSGRRRLGSLRTTAASEHQTHEDGGGKNKQQAQLHRVSIERASACFKDWTVAKGAVTPTAIEPTTTGPTSE